MLLLAPFVLTFLLFFLVPALQTFYLSLTESSLTRTNDFVGLANYATLVQDPSFWASRSSGEDPTAEPTWPREYV